MSDAFLGAGPSTVLGTDTTRGSLEVVHSFDGGPMPTGVSVSHTGRIFVNFPEWGDDVPATVVELVDGEPRAFPDEKWNEARGNDDSEAFVSVQSIVVDPRDRLWVLDTGSPMFKPTVHGGPKLVCVDLATDEVVQTILFDTDIALPTTYLNDVRFDLTVGAAGFAYITDSSDQGPNGIIVVDLATGDAWRRLNDHPSTKALPLAVMVPVAEGRVFAEREAGKPPQPVTMGADGIAISHDGERLWYCPLISRRWYSVDTGMLRDRDATDDAVAGSVIDEGDKGGGADGLESDDQGRIYLYFTANQLHRQDKYQDGDDLRVHPYHLFRVKIDAGPVLLR